MRETQKWNSYTVLLGVMLGMCCVTIDLRGQSVHLDSCYGWAEANFPLIQQYSLIEQTKEYTLSNAGKNFLPQLSITGVGGVLFTSGSSDLQLIGMAQLNQTIWDGGGTKAQKGIIEANAGVEKARLDVSRHELKTRVNQLFFGILLSDEQYKQVEQHEQILRNNADKIRQLIDNGRAFQTDYDEIQVELLQLQQQKTENRYLRQGYLQVLGLLIGRSLAKEVSLETPKPITTSRESPVLRPELGFFDSQRNLILAESATRKVDLMPKIGVMAVGVFIEPGVSLGPTQLSSLGVVGLSANWSLSGLYRNNNMKNLTEVNLAKLDVQRQTFMYQTTLQLSQTDANIQKQEAVLAKDEEIVRLRGKIREGYQVKYENGVSPLMDLLEAAERESLAKSQRSLHAMQLLLTRHEYKTQMGN